MGVASPCGGIAVADVESMLVLFGIGGAVLCLGLLVSVLLTQRAVGRIAIAHDKRADEAARRGDTERAFRVAAEQWGKESAEILGRGLDTTGAVLTMLNQSALTTQSELHSLIATLRDYEGFLGDEQGRVQR